MTQPTPPTANDLERLRDILYGEQTRDVDERLKSLSAQIEAAQHKLGEQLNRQGNSQTTAHQELVSRFEQQVSELQTQLNTVRQELSEQIQQLETKTRQRDDSLQQELKSLTDSLDSRKASREELGQLLIELGQRLQATRAD